LNLSIDGSKQVYYGLIRKLKEEEEKWRTDEIISRVFLQNFVMFES